MKMTVIQGPNLNMLGYRDHSLYGPAKLKDIQLKMKSVAEQHKFSIEFFQSNLEGELIDKIQECLGDSDGIIINPAAFTHTSIAIRDAILLVHIPTIEVHITNIYARGDFRSKNFISPVCTGSIIGFGIFGYHLAVISMINILNSLKSAKAKKNKT